MDALRLFELNTTALILNERRSSEMNVKSIAGQLGERRARFALSSDSAHPLADRWSVSDFVALTKPRVMMLAVFTALVGLSSAPVRLDPLTTLAAVLAIAAGAAAAGVLNMWYDADIDAVMSRTAMRPIPRGKISRFEALVFGLVLGGFAVAVLGLGDESHGGRTVGLHHPFLCCRVHGVAEAGHATEHRHRRRRWSAAAGDRVGRGNRGGRARAAYAVPHYLPLDAAAFLGSRAQSYATTMRVQACRCCRLSRDALQQRARS